MLSRLFVNLNFFTFLQNRFEGNLFKNITDIGQATIYLNNKNKVIRDVAPFNSGEFIDSVVKKMKQNKI